MPLNIWTPYHAAEMTMRGAEQFGAGIGGGLASAGRSFGQAIGEHKKRLLDELTKERDLAKKENKAGDSIRATLQALDDAKAIAEGRKPEPGKFKTVDNATAKGLLDARVMQEKAVADQAMREQHIQATAESKARMAEMARKADFEQGQQQAWGRAAGRLGEMGQPDEAVPYVWNQDERTRRMSPVTADTARGEALRAGVVPNKEFEDVIEAFRARVQPGTAAEIPGLPGHRFVIQNDRGAGTPVPVSSGKESDAPEVNAKELYGTPDEFNKYIQGLTPTQAKKAVEFRSKANRTEKSDSDDRFQQFIDALGVMGEKAKDKDKEKPAKPATATAPVKRFKIGPNGEPVEY